MNPFFFFFVVVVVVVVFLLTKREFNFQKYISNRRRSKRFRAVLEQRTVERESKTTRKWGESERGRGSRSIFRAAKTENSVPSRSLLPNHMKTLAIQAILVTELTSLTRR